MQRTCAYFLQSFFKHRLPAKKKKQTTSVSSIISNTNIQTEYFFFAHNRFQKPEIWTLVLVRQLTIFNCGRTTVLKWPTNILAPTIKKCKNRARKAIP